jgi:homoserine kinase
MKFTVRVPASTSNLGPGFDTLGLALNIHNNYIFDTDTTELKNTDFVYSSSVTDGDVPCSKENLVYRSFDYIFKKEGKKTPPVKIHFEANIPLSGGFGSSSTAIIAGIMAANCLLEEPYDIERLLKIGTQLDGHPDNITPALLGGFVVCVYANQELNYIKLPWNHDLFFVAVTPDFKVPTAKARAALPAKVNYQDAVFNVGYSSLLVAAVATKNTEMLKKAFKDRLHQEYRASLVPGMQYVLDTGLEAGAVGTMLSGAGSALIAVVDSEQKAQTVGSAMQAAWMQSNIKAEFRFLKAEEQGAKII